MCFSAGTQHVWVHRDTYGDNFGEQIALGLLAGMAAGTAMRSLLWMPFWFCWEQTERTDWKPSIKLSHNKCSCSYVHVNMRLVLNCFKLNGHLVVNQCVKEGFFFFHCLHLFGISIKLYNNYAQLMIVFSCCYDSALCILYM